MALANKYSPFVSSSNNASPNVDGCLLYTSSHPEGLGAKLVMLNALEDAELKPEDIDYINVHGTSTPVGDVSRCV